MSFKIFICLFLIEKMDKDLLDKVKQKTLLFFLLYSQFLSLDLSLYLKAIVVMVVIWFYYTILFFLFLAINH